MFIDFIDFFFLYSIAVRLTFVELVSSFVPNVCAPNISSDSLLKTETRNYFRNPQLVFILWNKSASIHIWLTLFDVSLYSN